MAVRAAASNFASLAAAFAARARARVNFSASIRNDRKSSPCGKPPALLLGEEESPEAFAFSSLESCWPCLLPPEEALGEPLGVRLGPAPVLFAPAPAPPRGVLLEPLKPRDCMRSPPPPRA